MRPNELSPRPSRIASAATIALGATVMLGWVLALEPLKGPIPGEITMKANTALAFILGGVALWLLANERASARGRWLARACAGGCALIGGLSLSQYLLGADLGIDELLFDDPPGAVKTVHPGRLAPQTALDFVLLGAALLLLEARSARAAWGAQCLALAAGAISLFALLGYAYAVDGLSTVAAFSPIAVHTAAGLLVLSVGVLTARPRLGLMPGLTSGRAGSVMARRLMIGALVALPVLGWLRLSGERAGLYDMETGVALLVVCLLAVIAGLAAGTARMLNRAEAEAEQVALAQGRLAAIVESSDDAILSKDAHATVTSWNRGAERLYGYTESEMVGRSLEAIIPPERAGEHEEVLGQVLRGQVLDHHETERVRKDGRRVWVSLTASPIRDRGGRIVGASVIARDITERKRAEESRRLAERRQAAEQVEEAELRLAESQELGRIGSWELDAASGELRCSDQLYRIYGHEPGAFPPSYDAFLDPVQSEDREPLERAIRDALAQAEPYVVDFRIARRDGEVRLLRARGQGDVDGDGNVSRLFGTVQDITERAQAERDKQQLEARLRQSERLESVGQLAGGVAHDFNNLLAVILNYADFVVEELDDGNPVRQDVEEIRRAAQRAAALTHQLLVFSRREVVNPTVLDLAAVVGDLEALLRRTLGEHVELRTSFDEGLWPVRADAGQIEQVLVNLAVNARDAMPGGGTLVIETSNVELDAGYARLHDMSPGRYARITVSDTGSGMSEEVRARVFEPFFTTKPKGEGTGLGLATVYGIVKQAGGQVDLYSEPGVGTVFKIYLPATADAAAPAQRPQERPLGGGETVLVVEDEGQVRELTRRILSRHGYEVLEAANGDEGLLVWERHGGNLDLLVTDVVMPGMSGRELAERMTSAQPGLGVLYISGYTDDFVARQGVLEEGVVLLEKPFTADQLLRSVRDVLEDHGRARGHAA